MITSMQHHVPNSRFYIDKICVIALILGLFLPNCALRSQTSLHVDWENQYSFVVPNGFEVQPNVVPNVATLITKKDTFYPSFNVVVQSGPYKISSLSDEQHFAKIEGDYTKVGISPIKLLKTLRWNSNQLRIFEALISYDHAGQQLTSSVLIVGGIKRHYILTWIDRSQDFEQHTHLRRKVFQSFNAWGDLGRGEAAALDTAGQTKWEGLLWGVFSLLIIAAIAVLLRRAFRLRRMDSES